MLERISEIKNIGVFKDYLLDPALNGDVKFSNMNIIYGKNGSGKSTLACLMRSLSSGDNNIVKGRRTVNGNSNQIATFTLDNDTYSFNESWNRVYPKLAIYDQQFINENIFIGDEISSENRRNQFEVIVGKDNIDKNTELVSINDILRELNREIKNIELDLTKMIVGNISITEFLNLESGIETEVIDNKLDELNKLKNNYNKISEILSIKYLEILDIPNFDIESFINLITADTKSINSEVETTMKNYMDEKDIELRWIQTGYNRIHDSKCPFCNQSMEDLDIFGIYKIIFDESINNYNSQLRYYNSFIEERFSVANSLKERLLIEKNLNTFKEIKRYVSSSDISIEIGETIGDRIVLLYNQFNIAIKMKIKDPFNSAYDCDTQKLKDDYKEFTMLLENYNKIIKKTNSRFKDYKLEFNDFTIKTVEEDICIYQNMKILKDLNTKIKVKRLKELNTEIANLSKRKDNIKATLSNINFVKIRDFNKTLNNMLADLGTAFEIKYIVPKFFVKGAEAEYRLIIKNKEVKTKVTKANVTKTPNFNNTLSQGEKSILAFAYFMTSLKFNKELSETIVIFDDPTNFSDISYKERMGEKITKLSSIVKQIIVLTHDMEFSRIMWELNIAHEVTGLYLDYFNDSAQITTREIYRDRNSKK